MPETIENIDRFLDIIRTDDVNLIYFVENDECRTCQDLDRLLTAYERQNHGVKFYKIYKNLTPEIPEKFQVRRYPSTMLLRNTKNSELIEGSNVEDITRLLNASDAFREQTNS